MTQRESSPPKSSAPKAASPEPGARTIPDKPRDCGPNVDTWPILDAQAGDAPKPKPRDRDESRN
jgi:hypothetical protein